jgi:hypothetical protein
VAPETRCCKAARLARRRVGRRTVHQCMACVQGPPGRRRREGRMDGTGVVARYSQRLATRAQQIWAQASRGCTRSQRPRALAMFRRRPDGGLKPCTHAHLLASALGQQHTNRQTPHRAHHHLTGLGSVDVCACAAASSAWTPRKQWPWPWPWK